MVIEMPTIMQFQTGIHRHRLMPKRGIEVVTSVYVLYGLSRRANMLGVVVTDTSVLELGHDRKNLDG